MEKMDKVNRQLVSLQQELHKRKNEEELREKKWREGRLAAEELEYEMRQEISGLKLKEQMLKNELKEVEERSKIKILAMEECQRKEI
jgi:nitrogen-specific signal transduction histidine kinase